VKALTPNQRKELEDIVTRMVAERERMEPRDRLTPRMHAADVLKAIRIYHDRQEAIDRDGSLSVVFSSTGGEG
jgi:predicted nucleic acid-binding OB-fold protein